MKRWIALVLLASWCCGCASLDEPSNPATPMPAWLKQNSTGPSETFFKRPFE